VTENSHASGVPSAIFFKSLKNIDIFWNEAAARRAIDAGRARFAGLFTGH
jgi:hypothetical protein